MQEGSVIRYTEQVAGEIASRYAESPLDELRLWVRLAHQREAMVTQLYELSEVEARLRGLPADGAAGVIRSVVLSVWAHETSHTQFLSSVRGASDALSGVAELQGKVEGWVTQQATAGNALARLLIAVGASLGRVPEFARELGRSDLPRAPPGGRRQASLV